MTEALLQYSSELSSSRITAATRVRYVNKQLMVYWQLPQLSWSYSRSTKSETGSNIFSRKLLASFCDTADNVDIYELRVRSYLVYLNRR